MIQAEHAAVSGKDKPFAQKLADDASPAGADGRPNRQLAPAGSAAREQHVRTLAHAIRSTRLTATRSAALAALT